MLVTMHLKKDEKPTQEMLDRIESASKRPSACDPDCPPLSQDEIAFFRQLIPIQRAIGRKLTGKETRILWNEWENKCWAHYIPEDTGDDVINSVVL